MYICVFMYMYAYIIMYMHIHLARNLLYVKTISLFSYFKVNPPLVEKTFEMLIFLPNGLAVVFCSEDHWEDIILLQIC